MHHVADWLNEYCFDFFCTFTTAKPCGLNSIRKIATKTIDYIRFGDLGDRSGYCGDYNASLFWCAESFDSTQGVTTANLRYPGDGILSYTSTRYHWHGLLKSEIDRNTLWSWYSSKYANEKNIARCQILPNTNQYSAAMYVSKYITKQLTDYDFFFSRKHSQEVHDKMEKIRERRGNI